MAQVLLAIHDDDLRQSLTWLLEDAGYTVSGTPNGITTFARLVTSPQPMTVLLDTHLPEQDAAGKLLELASRGGFLARHHYIVLSTARPETYLPTLASHQATMHLGVLTLPCDSDAVLSAVAQASAPPMPAPQTAGETMPAAIAPAS